MNRYFILTSSIIVASAAWAGSPGVTSITPAAGQRGTEMEVTVNGKSLADARSLLFNDPGIEVMGVSEAGKDSFKARLKIAPDARIGEYIFRGITRSGIADARLFYVTPYPLLSEAAEDKNAPAKPQPVPLGVSIHGSTPGEDQDHFEVDLKKGQRMVAEVVGVRLSTQQQYDPMVQITKADGKTVLAEMDDGAFTRQDPAVGIIAPEDGKYRVILKDATNSGPTPGNYVLHLGSHPRPVVAFPGGGRAGTELKVTFLGDVGGPFEQTVKLPDAPDTRLDVNAQKDGLTAPQVNFLRVADFDNVIEVEPNNDAEKATPSPGPLPLAFNGIIQEPGDIDYFKFSAKKDQAFDFKVFARYLRSQIDAVLGITKADGKGIASNDDSGGPDSYLRWKAPEDGDYRLFIHDQLKRGGPLFTYRVEVQPVRPMLSSYVPEAVENSSQQRRAVPVPRGNRYATLVRVKRADVGGEVVLDPQGVPAGVTVAGGNVGKDVDAAPIVFSAQTDAAPVQKTFRLLPKLADAAANAKVVSRVEHRVEITENGNQRSYYGVDEDSLALAVTDELPVTIELAQPKVPVFVDGQLGLKVTAARKAGAEGKPAYDGQIQIQLLFVPPGIGTPGVVNIGKGETEGTITVSANGKATPAKWKTCVIANFDAGDGQTWISTGLIELEIAPVFLAGAIKRTYVDQGSEGKVTVELDHKVPFDGKAKLKLEGLPSGVTAEDVEFTKDDKEVTFTIKAAPDVKTGQHKTLIATFTLVKNGEPMVSTIARNGILRVDKGGVPPKVAESKARSEK